MDLGVGLGLGLAGIHALLALSPSSLPRLGVKGANVSMDWRVLSFTVLAALITGLLFGLIPALQASRTDLTTSLKESGGRSGSGLVKPEEVDEIRAAALQAEADNNDAKYTLKLLELGPRKEKKAQAEARLVQCQADLDDAEKQLFNCDIRAPVTGTI